MIHKISAKQLTIDEIRGIIDNNYKLELSSDAIERIERCRDYLDRKMKNQNTPIYGITTGFGSLCNHSISMEELGVLQRNLVMSHACGTGDEVPIEIIRIMLVLKVQSLSYGNSGVQLQTVQRLIDFYNNETYPVVYQQGSLGASGDLAPLAHLCLPLLNEGEMWYKGAKIDASELCRIFGWKPIELASKEGLALLNGTQFMSAYAVYCLLKAEHLSSFADTIGALSLDAFDGRIEPFHPNIHNIRHHQGQIETAAVIRELLEGSEIIKREKKHVQDPYSFRCMPQVHGAAKDTIRHVKHVVTNEINAVTDNPTVFPDDDLVISAGNFHGQPLALVMDFLAIAMAELASISERRTYQLISGKRQLPDFLVAKPGLNSGFMIPQYTAASIVSQNKHLCMPACVDTIDSSQGQEDHVSMGANAATKLFRVLDNVERVLAIELMNAAQALQFRRPLNTSAVLEKLFVEYRKRVPFVENDVIMYPLITQSILFISGYKIN